MMLWREIGKRCVFNESNGLPFDFVTKIAEDANGTIWADSLAAGVWRPERSIPTLIIKKPKSPHRCFSVLPVGRKPTLASHF
jgi:hypothetical protein